MKAESKKTNRQIAEQLDMPVTNFYANGVAYASTQKSMMPLSIQQPNKPTRLISDVGNVTVSTS